MAEVLAASDLRKAYGSTVALDGVSLELETGEVFGLVGPNGAGKTTLVRCLTGTTRPSEGSVSLFGQPVREVDRGRIGLLPQSFSPHERLTARELVSYYAGLYEDPRSPESVLADVGMAEAAHQPYLTLSGGQQRRVCVAIAVVNQPEILFLDEPTTGIDPAGRRSLWRLVSSLSEAGTTVLLTTHYMEEAEQLADRVGLLADGRLVTVGSPTDVVHRY
ncbi:MAG: ABC transporter ATP-binding protein, partial [Halobacteriales archaeon]|nr:ABC transporter ATP-binding protein [Halobacteriales archaeon]